MNIRGLLSGQPFMTQYGIVGYSSVVLVEDEDRRILFDCGSRGCSVQLKNALNEAGLAPEDITDVVVSHMHFDHVGNLPLFKNARILMSETEWKNALISPDEYHCIATASYIRESGRLTFIEEGDSLTENVRVIALPGHTKGLIGLVCGGDTVLCSDAIKNRWELWEGLEPMTVDLEESLRTMDRIRSIARYIYPGHDTRLDLQHKENTPPVDIWIRYADGLIRFVER